MNISSVLQSFVMDLRMMISDSGIQTRISDEESQITVENIRLELVHDSDGDTFIFKHDALYLLREVDSSI